MREMAAQGGSALLAQVAAFTAVRELASRPSRWLLTTRSQRERGASALAEASAALRTAVEAQLTELGRSRELTGSAERLAAAAQARGLRAEVVDQLVGWAPAIEQVARAQLPPQVVERLFRAVGQVALDAAVRSALGEGTGEAGVAYPRQVLTQLWNDRLAVWTTSARLIDAFARDAVDGILGRQGAREDSAGSKEGPCRLGGAWSCGRWGVPAGPDLGKAGRSGYGKAGRSGCGGGRRAAHGGGSPGAQLPG